MNIWRNVLLKEATPRIKNLREKQILKRRQYYRRKASCVCEHERERERDFVRVVGVERQLPPFAGHLQKLF